MSDSILNVQIKQTPKICTIDLDPEIVESLKSKGFQCFSGTLGSQVKVPNSYRGHEHKCLLNYDFPPNLHEYDIIILDLKERESVEYITAKHTREYSKGREQLYLLSSYPETVFDPRPFASAILEKELKSFFKRDTIIIIFCSTNEIIEYHPITMKSNGYKSEYPETYSLYSFVPGLQNLHNKVGFNVTISTNISCLKSLFQKYINSFTYKLIFNHPKDFDITSRQMVEREAFFPLLLNSDREPVGFIDLLMGQTAVIALPQINGCKKNFVLELIENTLPEVFPTLFPYSEQFSWLKSEAYLLPNQSNLLEEKIQLQTAYEKTIVETDRKIDDNKA